MSHAVFIANWNSHKHDVSRIAKQLGRPHGGTVDEEHAMASVIALREVGISFLEHAINYVPWATDAYSTGPWSSDIPVISVFKFVEIGSGSHQMSSFSANAKGTG